MPLISPKKLKFNVVTKRFGRGETAKPAQYAPGDFILTHGNDFFDGLIRFGEALRFQGPDRPFAWWSHAALIVSKKGDIIEAVGAGVRRATLAEYKETEYHLIHLKPSLADANDRRQVVEFAVYCLGQPYGITTIISIALCLLTGCKFSFGFNGQEICSGLVSRALERTSAIFSRDPSHMMPADLAKFFNVPKGSDKGLPPHRGPFLKPAS